MFSLYHICKYAYTYKLHKNMCTHLDILPLAICVHICYHTITAREHGAAPNKPQQTADLPVKSSSIAQYILDAVRPRVSLKKSNRKKGINIMSSMEIISKIEALKEWEKLAAEAAAEIEALKDSIKREMDSRNLEELAAGQYIARFTVVVTNRLDTTALKRENNTMYQRYLKQTTSRRFSIS